MIYILSLSTKKEIQNKTKKIKSQIYFLGDTTIDVLTRLAHDIYEEKLEFQTARKKNFFERTYRKFADYYPASLLCFVPVVLIVMSCMVSVNPRKEKKH